MELARGYEALRFLLIDGGKGVDSAAAAAAAATTQLTLLPLLPPPLPSTATALSHLVERVEVHRVLVRLRRSYIVGSQHAEAVARAVVALVLRERGGGREVPVFFPARCLVRV